jgi:hypothetical protein
MNKKIIIAIVLIAFAASPVAVLAKRWHSNNNYSNYPNSQQPYNNYQNYNYNPQPTTPVPVTSNQNSFINFFLGDPCLVPVYHTDFIFPSEGGAVIRINNDLFFVPTYLSGCSNYLSRGTVVKTAGQVNAPVVQPTGTAGGNLLNFAIGDPCLVPVYTTNFAFPAEGGHIIQVGNQMYFAKTYQAGCESATTGATVIR